MSWLTIDIAKDVETGRVTVTTRASKRHWDEPCPCKDPDCKEPDIHDDIVTVQHPDGVRFRSFKTINFAKMAAMELYFMKEPK